MKKRKTKSWLKNKGYLHITNRIDLHSDRSKIITYVKNPGLIKNHAFYPLLFKIIPQRRFKIVGYDSENRPIRAHKKLDRQGVYASTKKNRPIHYATHLDAHVLAYYSSQILGKNYENFLKSNSFLSESIIAYRRISIEDSNVNKNNIHFAKEVFDFIRKRPNSVAMAFDIENFFPTLNHAHLKRSWCKILSTKSLPPDHYNIYKNITKYSYIKLDQLRNKRGAFDEKRLSIIRKSGVSSFFESPEEFRNNVKNGLVKIYKNQYHDLKGNLCGIPQGLAISAMLANIYLLEFDEVVARVIKEKNGLYRRYSDDIAVVCDIEDWQDIESIIVTEIEKYSLKINSDKTEIVMFNQNRDKTYLESTAIVRNKYGLIKKKSFPFRYLGFEFNGRNILIKSKNISKFYRRLKYSVKIKGKRIKKRLEDDPLTKPIFFKRRLLRIYTSNGAKTRIIDRKIKKLEKNERFGYYEYNIYIKRSRYWGNFIGYVQRASEIMKEPKIARQLRNHHKILKKEIEKQLQKLKDN